MLTCHGSKRERESPEALRYQTSISHETYGMDVAEVVGTQRSSAGSRIPCDVQVKRCTFRMVVYSRTVAQVATGLHIVMTVIDVRTRPIEFCATARCGKHMYKCTGEQLYVQPRM